MGKKGRERRALDALAVAAAKKVWPFHLCWDVVAGYVLPYCDFLVLEAVGQVYPNLLEEAEVPDSLVNLCYRQCFNSLDGANWEKFKRARARGGRVARDPVYRHRLQFLYDVLPPSHPSFTCRPASLTERVCFDLPLFALKPTDKATPETYNRAFARRLLVDAVHASHLTLPKTVVRCPHLQIVVEFLVTGNICIGSARCVALVSCSQCKATIRPAGSPKV